MLSYMFNLEQLLLQAVAFTRYRKKHKAHPLINHSQQIIIEVPTLPQQVIYHTAGDAITCY